MRPADAIAKALQDGPLHACLESVAAITQDAIVHLVGGAVRDILLGEPVIDLDFSIQGGQPIAEMAEALVKKWNGSCFELNARLASWRVLLPDGRTLDLTALEGRNQIDDCLRRDLTINAIALRLNAGGYLQSAPVDPSDGLGDLERKLLRLPRADAFRIDPVRAVRLYRFAAWPGFTVDPSARKAASEAARKLPDMPDERVGGEWAKALAQSMSADAVAMAADDEVLFFIHPSLETTRDCEQNAYHHLPVLGHSIRTLAEVETILADPSSRLGATAPDFKEKTGDPDFPVGLKLAALCHDAGKPESKGVREDGRSTFYGHEKIGEEIIRRELRDLAFPKTVVRYVSELIRHHMRLGFLAVKHVRGELTPRATARMLREVGPLWRPLGLLAIADNIAMAGPLADPNTPDTIRIYMDHLLDLERKRRQAAALGKPPIDGRDLIEALGVAQGPLVGKALAAVWEAFYLDPAIDRQTALRIAGEVLNEPQHPGNS